MRVPTTRAGPSTTLGMTVTRGGSPERGGHAAARVPRGHAARRGGGMAALRRVSGGMAAALRASPAEQLAPSIDPIRCAPRVFVLLRAAQKIERRRALAHRFFHRVRDDDVADAQALERGIESAEVVVDRA